MDRRYWVKVKVDIDLCHNRTGTQNRKKERCVMIHFDEVCTIICCELSSISSERFHNSANNYINNCNFLFINKLIHCNTYNNFNFLASVELNYIKAQNERYR